MEVSTGPTPNWLTVWPNLEGQTAIVQMHVDLWNTAFKGSKVNGSVRKTRQLSPTHMVANFDMELSLFRETALCRFCACAADASGAQLGRRA
jgi:hypothetical protein